MSCDHVWSAWTTSESVNAAGERTFVFARRCYLCSFIEETAGAIVSQEPFQYAKTLTGKERPDD